MEVSKSLQTDIRNIQTQLKIAIQNHQIVVLKMRNDPLNIQMKNKLLGLQKHIILLGEKQKRLVQQLRKEVEANSTNSTLTVKSVALSLGFSSNFNNNNNITNNNNHTVKCMPIRPSSVSSTSSSTTLEDSEDSQREHDEVVTKCCSNTGSDPSLATKLQFMSAVGLVTREVLSELQNRRVERKRRSTANHTQFVYGNSWDVSKRKKNNYLASGVPPPPRRSLRTEPVPENPDTLHIPGLPASLTIERVKASDKVCMVCRKPGSQLSVCNTCTSDYHSACASRCPQCNFQDPSVHVVLIAEREAERQKLQDFNKHITSDTESLQKRAAELSAALKAQEPSRNETSCLLQAQEAHRKAILQSEELTRNSIQRIQDLVTIFKSAPS